MRHTNLRPIVAPRFLAASRKAQQASVSSTAARNAGSNGVLAGRIDPASTLRVGPRADRAAQVERHRGGEYLDIAGDMDTAARPDTEPRQGVSSISLPVAKR